MDTHPNEIGRERSELFDLASRKPSFDHKILALDVTKFPQTPAERLDDSSG